MKRVQNIGYRNTCYNVTTPALWNSQLDLQLWLRFLSSVQPIGTVPSPENDKIVENKKKMESEGELFELIYVILFIYVFLENFKI